MKLSPIVIQTLSSSRDPHAKRIRCLLALELNCTERWVQDNIKTNRDNGPLTTVKAIQVLKKEMGLSQGQILVEDKKQAAA